jgi:hypothetical protein
VWRGPVRPLLVEMGYAMTRGGGAGAEEEVGEEERGGGGGGGRKERAPGFAGRSRYLRAIEKSEGRSDTASKKS